jgi:hypothetical protein
MYRPFLLLALASCATSDTCETAPVIVDLTGELPPEIRAAMEDEVRSFDALTPGQICATITVDTYAYTAQRSGRQVTATVDVRDLDNYDLEARAVTRGALCEAMQPEWEPEPPARHFHDEPVWMDADEVVRRYFSRAEPDAFGPLTEAQAGWIAACAAGPRPEAPLRRFLHEQCGAATWGDGLEYLAHTLWSETEEAAFEAGVAELGTARTVGQTEIRGRVISLWPHQIGPST